MLVQKPGRQPPRPQPPRPQPPRPQPPAMPVRRLPGLLRRAATDSLARNSFYLMASTVTTGGLGYFFWIIAAHIFTKQEIGVGAAIISLCSTISLVTALGPSVMLVERLPKSEHSSKWAATLYRTCSATAIVTAMVMAIAVLPAVLISHNYRSFFAGPSEILIVAACAGTTTLLDLIGYAFIAARRAGRLLVHANPGKRRQASLPIPAGGFGRSRARRGVGCQRCNRHRSGDRMARAHNGPGQASQP